MKTNGRNLLTHSRMQSFLRCRRKHQFEYIIGVRPEQGDALRTGSAVHAGLDALKAGESFDVAERAVVAWYQTSIDRADTGERVSKLLFECAKAVEIVRGWHGRWRGEAIQVVETEISFNLPLRNPNPRGRRSRCFRFAGKIDGICLLEDGRLALLEHKTTSDDIAFDSTYWENLRLDRQITLYLIAARELGHDIRTILYDVIHKPGMLPRLATPLDKRKYKKDGTLYANQRAHPETPEEYGGRIRVDIEERSDHYYQRREIPRLQSDIDQVRQELWQVQGDMRDATKSESHYRNTGACRSPYPCPYISVCSTDFDLKNETPDDFVRLEFVHPELQENDDHASISPGSKTPAASEGGTPEDCEHDEPAERSISSYAAG